MALVGKPGRLLRTMFRRQLTRDLRLRPGTPQILMVRAVS